MSEYRPGADVVRDISKGHPVGRWNNDIVAFVHESGAQIKDGVLPTHVYDAF
jgi:hypothetical protein